MTQNSINSKNVLSQFKTTSTTSLVTCSTTIPADDTIPQSGEGTQILTLSITPRSATSTLVIIFTSVVSPNLNAFTMTTALFQDSNTDATAASFCSVGSNDTVSAYLRHVMTSGTTSSTTFKIRVGPSANTCYVNGNNSGTVVMGGVSETRLTIFEYI